MVGDSTRILHQDVVFSPYRIANFKGCAYPRHHLRVGNIDRRVSCCPGHDGLLKSQMRPSAVIPMWRFRQSTWWSSSATIGPSGPSQTTPQAQRMWFISPSRSHIAGTAG